MLNPVPVWRKIVFDGKKIRIHLEAFPSIFVKGKDFGFEEDSGYEEEVIIYRLHFKIDFKKPEEQLDIKSKISEIKGLAEAANADPSKENMNALAKKSVNVEKTFNDRFRQGSGECVDLMNSIFGSENKRETQKKIVEEISFYEGDNFEAIMRLEYCDDCEWKGVHLNMHIEGRGPGFHMPSDFGGDEGDRRKYEGLDTDRFKSEIRRLILDIKGALEAGNFGQAMSSSNKLEMLNRAWDEHSNHDVWDKVKEESEGRRVEMELQKNNEDEEEGGMMHDPYFWIEEDKRQREKVKQIQQVNYEDKKRFFGELFSGYNKREFYFESEEWEMRLVEVFMAHGEEICSNNKDDNNNGQKDCEESQCGGKFCGKEILESGEEVDLYCIGKPSICQQKEIIDKPKDPVCGNNICELGENIPPVGGVVEEAEEEESEVEEEEIGEEESTTAVASITGNVVAEDSEGEDGEDEGEGEEIEESGEDSSDSEVKSFYCPQDCVECPVYDAVECENGKLMFSGTDENGCQLPPVCVEDKVCFSDDECEYRCLAILLKSI